MSDLEQSNIENMSDNDTYVDELQPISPTFPMSNEEKKNTKQNAIKSMNIDDLDNGANDDVDNGINDDEDNETNVDNDEDIDGSDDDNYEVPSDDDDDDDDDDDSITNSLDGDDSIMDDNNKLSSKKKSTIKSGKLKNTEELQTPILDIPVNFEKNDSDYESDDDDEEDDEYLQKFDKEMRQNYILDQHPESVNHNYDEIYQLASVQRNKENIIIDDLHKTIPILTKYEKTRILGLRAKQLNNGARPMIKMNVPIIDGYLIALKELEEKSIPVIIRRPLPNGSTEYWHLKDLEILQ